MKKPFEDRITERIKEVMEQYEPDYSPQAWEKLREQMPVPVFWLKKLFLKYRYWISGVAIVGVLLVAYKVSSEQPSDKSSSINPISSESANYFVSEKPKEVAYSEKSPALRPGISNIGIPRKEKNISSKAMPVRLTNSLPAAYQDYIQTEKTIAERHESIEIKPVIPISLNETDFGNQESNSQPIPIKAQAEEIPVLKSLSFVKKGKSEFRWPEFNFMFKKEEGYDKFAGPNKLAFFYSPEMVHSNSLNNLGVSHGIGISLEGLIRSSVSISAGLSYQAIDFRKTIFSEKILPQGETIYIDSIGISRGSYEYLEVPVSINFNFFDNNRSQVWLGTGISSIVFFKQNYTSETIVGGIISDQVSSSAKGWENLLPLASLNLSLLYRYKLSDRLFLHSSVQSKQHLVSLGYNSMKLNRLSLQVGLMYRFGKED
jgi:hypothetical protein